MKKHQSAPDKRFLPDYAKVSGYVHLIVMIPPKVSMSYLMGKLKGQTSQKVFNHFRELRKKPYWGNHFWAKGYCVDTIGMDAMRA